MQIAKHFILLGKLKSVFHIIQTTCSKSLPQLLFKGTTMSLVMCIRTICFSAVQTGTKRILFIRKTPFSRLSRFWITLKPSRLAFHHRILTPTHSQTMRCLQAARGQIYPNTTQWNCFTLHATPALLGWLVPIVPYSLWREKDFFPAGTRK